MGRVRVAGFCVLVVACGRTSVDELDESTGVDVDPSSEGSDGGEVGGDPPSTSAATSDGSTSAPGDGSSSDGPDAPAGCGDGVVMDTELCDDGNRVPADGCNPDCVPSGHALWTVELPSTDISDWTIHERLAVGSAGEIAIAGASTGDEIVAILTVLASDGVPIAEHLLTGAHEVRVSGLAFREGGELVIAGDSRNGNGPRTVWLQTRDAATFEPIEELEIQLPHGVAIDAFAPAPDDGIVWALDNDGVELQQRDAAGELVWSDAPADLAIDTIAVDPFDGDIAAGGDFPADVRGAAPDVALWSSAGTLVWTLDLQELTGHAFVDRTSITPTGEIVLLAGQFPPPGDQLGIVALSPDASIAWQHENYELGTIDAAHELPSMRDVTIDAVGDIVVVGWASRSEGGADPWLFKLDAAGALRWQAIVPSPDEGAPYDYGLMVATAPDTTIVIAGRRGTNPGDLTWVTSTTP